MRPSSLLLAALLLTVFMAGADADPPPGTQNPLVGQAFGATDALRWMTKDGKPFTFGNQPYTLLRWWTNGCAHCSASVPALARLERKHARNGLRMVAVYHPKGRALRSERGIRTYLGRLGFTGDVAVDRRWTKLKGLMARGKLTQATSVSFLVDSSGVVRWVHPGPRLYTTSDPDWAHADRSYRELDALLTRLLDPARRRILFQRKSRAWLCSPDGTGAGPLELAHKPDATPVWDPAGRRVAYPTVVGRRRQVVVATPRGKTRLFDPGIGGARVNALRWSPKGNGLLIVLEYMTVEATCVLLLDPETGGLTKIATDGRKDLTACWHPSGRALAICTITKEWQTESGHATVRHFDAAIDVLVLETAKRRRFVTPEKSVSDLAWSPDGKILAYGTDRGLWFLDADGGNRRRISDQTASGQPRWSPDGKYIAIAHSSAGSWDLALFTREGKPARHWRDAGYLDGIAWSPDGAQLIYVRVGQLLRVPAAGGKPTVLSTGAGYGGLSWR